MAILGRSMDIIKSNVNDLLVRAEDSLARARSGVIGELLKGVN